MSKLSIGLVGVGKIARDQHIPALAHSARFALSACASRNAKVDGVDNFPTIEAMLEARPDLDAISICTPPQFHFEAARLALSRGKHVMLEKPPCATTAELSALARLAGKNRKSLFQSWHSRFAAGVAPARAFLAGRKITSGRISWKEDVRVWHPGQGWIWQAGGFGVFDPGINALSIFTEIVPEPVFVQRSVLHVPVNCASPIQVELTLRCESGALAEVEFDFLQTGPQTWDIEIETNDGSLVLSEGGGKLAINGAPAPLDSEGEYPGLYRRFGALIDAGESEADGGPMQLVADAFLIGERVDAPEFIE